MHMVNSMVQPLAGAVTVETIIAVIVTLGALVKWVFAQIQEAAKNQAAQQRAAQGAARQQPQQRPQPNAARPPGAADSPVNAGGQQADPLREQVEEFLRRAGRQQPGQPPAPKRKP